MVIETIEICLNTTDTYMLAKLCSLHLHVKQVNVNWI